MSFIHRANSRPRSFRLQHGFQVAEIASRLPISRQSGVSGAACPWAGFQGWHSLGRDRKGGSSCAVVQPPIKRDTVGTLSFKVSALAVRCRGNGNARRGFHSLSATARGGVLSPRPVQSGKLWRHPTGARLGWVEGQARPASESRGGSLWAGILRAARPCNGGSKGAISPLWRGDVAQQCITSPFSLFSPAPDFSAALPVAVTASPKTTGGVLCYTGFLVFTMGGGGRLVGVWRYSG